jgi:hypothetical protein
VARAAKGQPTSSGTAAGAFAALADLELPRELVAELPAGYVAGAVLPELYLRAAAGLRSVRPLQVIGVRGIGTSLAPLVAAAADASADPVTVRPTPGGVVEVEEALGKALLRHPACHYVLIDEGPDRGAAAAADWLEDHGVALSHITFMPSRAGEPAATASARHRRRWRSARRLALETDAAPLVPRWLGLADDHPLLDLSAGAWRGELCGAPADWPVAVVHQERRKYFFQAADGEPCLAKYEGPGPFGAEAFARARALAALALVPAPLGLRHGFLVSRWETATPLSLGREHDREALSEAVVRYLVAIGHTPAGDGATPARLLAMARHNTGEALGGELALALDRYEEELSRLTHAALPVATDNKMHACEWLERPDGTFLKADALHHHRDRSLVGSQDLFWDVAGAEVELGLDGDALAERLAHAGLCRPDPRRLAFYRACYLAFQAGRLGVAADEAAVAGEAALLREAAGDYAARLRRCLSGGA